MTREELLNAYADGQREFVGANLAGANLARANLAHADLARANLVGAHLVGANLAGAQTADQLIVQGPTRSDGYSFILTRFDCEGPVPRIKAGCRDFTYSEAVRHWEQTRGATPLGRETLLILDYLRATAEMRGVSVS